MRAKLSPFIEGDLNAIADYISRDNPTRAITVVREIRSKLRQIAKQPLLYQLRPEIAEHARIVMVGPYAILFRTAGKIVTFERVIYAGRDLGPFLLPPVD